MLVPAVEKNEDGRRIPRSLHSGLADSLPSSMQADAKPGRNANSPMPSPMQQDLLLDSNTADAFHSLRFAGGLIGTVHCFANGPSMFGNATR
jgi:hypothetical protein